MRILFVVIISILLVGCTSTQPEIANIVNAIFTTFSCCFMGLQTIIVFVALIYAARQIKEARKEQLLSAVWEVFDALDSEKTREARTYIYENKNLYKSLEGCTVEKLKELPPQAQENAQFVSNSFDRIGYVVSQRLVPVNLILDGYYPIAAKCWLILKPYIEATRNLRKQREYQMYFQSLGELALKRYTSPEEVRQQLY